MTSDKDIVIGRIELGHGVKSEEYTTNGPYLSAEHLLQARVKELEAQLASTKLKWQTGKPPKDAWYWTRIRFAPHLEWVDIEMRYFDVDARSPLTWENRQWAGPIPEPEE